MKTECKPKRSLKKKKNKLMFDHFDRFLASESSRDFLTIEVDKSLSK